MRDRAVAEAQERDGNEMRARLAVWDDDESDELYYTDRSRWRHMRSRRLATEEQSDRESRMLEEREAEHLRRESEAFLERQMEDMQALQDEQRKAGMLLDDGAPVRLAVSLAAAASAAKTEGTAGGAGVKVAFNAEEDEEEAARTRKAPLVKLDFSTTANPEMQREQLEKVKSMVPRDKVALFKAKVRWDALTDVCVSFSGMSALLTMRQTVIDRKFEPFVHRLLVKYLGELEDDDLVLFVLEHLKDHKTPQKLVDGLEPVSSLSVYHHHRLLTSVCRSWKKTRKSLQSPYGGRLSSRAWHTARVYIQRK
jgi:RNA-binding protein 25